MKWIYYFSRIKDINLVEETDTLTTIGSLELLGELHRKRWVLCGFLKDMRNLVVYVFQAEEILYL